MTPTRIRVISICLFWHHNRILVMPGYDSVKQTYFYRPLGGGVEPGETSADALVREIREELSLEITDIQLLSVLESLFVYDGVPAHEIVFVYDARFADHSFYERARLQGVEDDGVPFEVVWRHVDSFSELHRLVPDGLAAVIQNGAGYGD